MLESAIARNQFECKFYIANIRLVELEISTNQKPIAL